ncbi:MAG TPA: hypothetical protein VIJ70_01865 [Gaiellaceae bacterium]
MPDRRGTRFIAEVAFLVALAAGVTIAELSGLEIAGIMLLGWAVMAAVEWAAWRDTPHYGHGLPPRYYVPRVSLPPPQALEQVAAGYPEAQRDEAPTWIASADLRAELLGEWPVAVPVGPSEDTEADLSTELPMVLPPVAVEVPVPEEPPEELPAEQPVEPSGEPSGAAPKPVPATSRYSLDPLADEPEQKRFGRRARSEEAPAIDVPTRPAGTRPLPPPPE